MNNPTNSILSKRLKKLFINKEKKKISIEQVISETLIKYQVIREMLIQTPMWYPNSNSDVVSKLNSASYLSAAANR